MDLIICPSFILCFTCCQEIQLFQQECHLLQTGEREGEREIACKSITSRVIGTPIYSFIYCIKVTRQVVRLKATCTSPFDHEPLNFAEVGLRSVKSSFDFGDKGLG